MSLELLSKDMDYIRSKKEKINSEINLISSRKYRVQLMGVSDKDPLKLKHWQLGVIKQIEKTHIAQLIPTFEMHRKTMCKLCQEHLKDDDIQCSKDKYHFILCSMIAHSMIGFWELHN